MMRRMTKGLSLALMLAMTAASLGACGAQTNQGGATSEAEAGSQDITVNTAASTAVMSNEEIIKKAASEGKVSNWGIGNQYEIQALLAKYGLPTDYLSEDFTMDAFDDDSSTLASAMTYNELGLVKNSYDGGYGYGDAVGVIDMNEEGVAMLEDMIFCTREFAEKNPETVKAFLYASLKGWEYAVENPEEAAEICYEAGSSVSQDHQSYMAQQVAKLVSTDMNGNDVSGDAIGQINMDAMQQTLNLAQQYVELDDAAANEKFQGMKVEDFVDTSYYEAVMESDGTFTPEKSEVSIQLKWLPDAQFMGYYVAIAKGYYDEVGLTVTVVSGGGDISETTAVNNGTVDFGQTWPTNMAVANAGGMDLIEISQLFQRSGMTLVYKYDNFMTE